MLSRRSFASKDNQLLLMHTGCRAHLLCRSAALHSASFIARLRSTSRMTMLASCVNKVVLSALKSRAFVSKMHLHHERHNGRKQSTTTITLAQLKQKAALFKAWLQQRLQRPQA